MTEVAQDDRLVVAGKLRSQTKLSGWLAHASGSVLVATEMADQDEEDMADTEAFLLDLLSNSFSRSIKFSQIFNSQQHKKID